MVRPDFADGTESSPVAAAVEARGGRDLEGARKLGNRRQLDTYTEYSLFSAALKSQDPRKRIELADALDARNPKSQYLPMLAEIRFNPYQSVGR